MQNEVVPALRQSVVATQASAVKLKIVDALLWLHLPSQPTVTPALMRSAVHLCTPSQSPVAGCAPHARCSLLPSNRVTCMPNLHLLKALLSAAAGQDCSIREACVAWLAGTACATTAQI
jgi:hypothetical protein